MEAFILLLTYLIQFLILFSHAESMPQRKAKEVHTPVLYAANLPPVETYSVKSTSKGLGEIEPSPWQFGILGGVNFSYAASDPGQNGHSRNTFSFSLGIERALGTYFALGMEWGWVKRGVNTVVYSLGTFDINGDVNLDYLAMPILLKAKIPLGKKLNVFVQSGPDFAIALNREAQVLGMMNVDASNQFRWYDFSLLAGSGLEYTIQRDLVFQSMVRYTYGLINIYTGDRSYKTRGIELLVGVRLGF